jgi:hypothetical protein
MQESRTISIEKIPAVTSRGLINGFVVERHNKLFSADQKEGSLRYILPQVAQIHGSKKPESEDEIPREWRWSGEQVTGENKDSYRETQKTSLFYYSDQSMQKSVRI